VNDLVLAAFAAEIGGHIVEEPRERRFERFRRDFDECGFRASLAARGLRFLGRGEPSYPSALRELHDSPPGLFLRGSGAVELLGRRGVAIVGARACSSYGSQVARLLGRELTAAGIVVVSGLARGIDGDAHRGALEAGGPTLAVLGCGVDRDYPVAHAQLAARISEQGLVVSEYAPGVEPAPWRFPARNRIIAGLAAATIVVEARERSGALITADFALEAGREVFAVPGEITSSLSAGTNALLRLGATPLTSTGDVLEALGIDAAPVPSPELGEIPARVLYALVREPSGIDGLIHATGLDAAAVATALAELELAGAVAEADGLYRGVKPQGHFSRLAPRGANGRGLA
jgi:DNA processing protein